MGASCSGSSGPQPTQKEHEEFSKMLDELEKRRRRHNKLAAAWLILVCVVVVTSIATIGWGVNYIGLFALGGFLALGLTFLALIQITTGF